MALNCLSYADVPLRNYSLTHSLASSSVIMKIFTLGLLEGWR